MNRRKLGRTEIEVSEISFGAVEIGIPYGIGIENFDDMVSENEAIKLLNCALENGMNFFDTASSYGRSEEIIGKAFKDKREHVVICTKCKPLIDDDNNKLLPGKDVPGIIADSLQKSLSDLRTDYIDVYMIHSANLDVINNHEITEIFTQLRDKGIARSIGVSVYTVEETRQAVESGIWDVVQLPYNLMDQSHGEGFSLAARHGVGIVVRSVLLKGVLTDRGSDLHPKLKAVQQHCDLYKEFLNEDIPTLSDLATKFVLSHKDVSSVLVGIDRMEYLQKALAVADGNYLDQNTLARAQQLQYPDRGFLDLTIWRKKGWLKGN